MLEHQQIVERDDGRYEVGLVDPAGPFESRQFAAAVAAILMVREGRQPPATVPARRAGR